MCLPKAIALSLVIATLAVLPGTSVAVGTSDMGAFPGMGGIRFAADASATPVPEGDGTVVVAYAVTYDELFFLRDGDGYRDHSR